MGKRNLSNIVIETGQYEMSLKEHQQEPMMLYADREHMPAADLVAASAHLISGLATMRLSEARVLLPIFEKMATLSAQEPVYSIMIWTSLRDICRAVYEEGQIAMALQDNSLVTGPLALELLAEFEEVVA